MATLNPDMTMAGRRALLLIGDTDVIATLEGSYSLANELLDVGAPIGKISLFWRTAYMTRVS
jgi:hypothetical protein